MIISNFAIEELTSHLIASKHVVARQEEFDTLIPNFYKELNEFFKEISKYTTCEFDISEAMTPGHIYAEYDTNGKFHNVDPKYTNIFKAL